MPPRLEFPEPRKGPGPVWSFHWLHISLNTLFLDFVIHLFLPTFSHHGQGQYTSAKAKVSFGRLPISHKNKQPIPRNKGFGAIPAYPTEKLETDQKAQEFLVQVIPLHNVFLKSSSNQSSH